MLLRTFGFSIAITLVALAASFFLFSPAGFVLVAVLIVLEVSLSFDNAVVNAKVLKRMSPFWQKIFLTIGILIAVFGMRLVFPVLLVSATAGITPVEAVDLAIQGGSIEEPGTYANLVNDAHPAIAGFGGMFLMMLFLDWLFEDREIHWITFLEKPLQKLGALESMSVIVALSALTGAAAAFADDEHFGQVMISGVLGVVTYLLVGGLGNLFEGQGGEDEDDEDEVGALEKADVPAAAETAPGRSGPNTAQLATGKAGLFLFLYLEVLDASFSFDGVIGAFAITQDIFIIMIGLGVGAFWIRSLTVYLVRQGTLDEYAYLEHGAHWAIGALAAILLVTIKYEISEIITGLIGVVFIAASFVMSIARNKKLDRESATHDHPHMHI
ncbi:DUF475 domain-containing protein [Angustibacter speluncae]